MYLIGGPNFIEGFFWSWFGCVSLGLSGCEVCILIGRGLDWAGWVRGNIMAPKFVEGTHTDNIMAPRFGILGRPLWPWPVLLYFESSKLDPLISAFQHLAQLPAAGLIFGHAATETDPRLLRCKRMLMRRREARPPQLLIFVLRRTTPLAPR